MNKWIYHESEYLESSSNKKELLTALFESSVISTLIFAITYSYRRERDRWYKYKLVKEMLRQIITYVRGDAVCAIFIVPVHRTYPV